MASKSEMLPLLWKISPYGPRCSLRLQRPILVNGDRNRIRLLTRLSVRSCSTVAENTTEVKPYASIPGPKYRVPIIPQLYSMYKYKNRAHIGMQDAMKTFGPIYKVNVFGIMELVYIGDVEAIAKLHRHDGRTPSRMILDVWKEWRDENGHSLGILISSGEEWKRMRTQLDKQMLRPQVVHTYTDDFNEVVTDFVQHIRDIRSENGAVTELNEQLFRWSLEGMGKVLYDTRFGSFTSRNQPEITRFIQSVHELFMTAEILPNYPRSIRKSLLRKTQKLHDDAWDSIFSTGKKLIDEKLEKIKEDLKNGKEVTGFLAALLTNEKLHMEDIYANVSELMLAAVDTTSNSMQWALYHLTKDRQTLERLQTEVRNVTPRGTIPTKDDLDQMPYLKAVIKEVLRLVPVAGVITRTTTQDMVLCGYHIPCGTKVIGLTYQMGRDPANYSDPDTFKPERWLREDGKHTHTFAWLPFGHGARMCIGKRVAELEMHLLLARLVQEFDMTSGPNDDIRIVTKGLLQPNKSVNINFTDAL